MDSNEPFTEKIPYGELGLIALESSRKIGKKVDDYIIKWRADHEEQHATIAFSGYKKILI